MADIKQTMFREYDIRGKEAPDELNEDSMYLIGKGLGTYLRNENINSAVVGHDSRASSESFYRQVTKGLNETGVDVIDIGEATTPMGYWAQHYFKVKGGIVITASHNPVGWNGAKISDGLSKNLAGSEIQKIYEIISKDNFTSGGGKIVKNEDIKEAYINDLISKAKINKKYKILVNTANGTAAIVAPELLRKAGCVVIEHNTNIDPTYPNYTPNPENKAFMEDTAKKTIENNCDFGLAFDGDCDRLGFVDNKGNILASDVLFAFIARLFLKNHSGAKVMFDVKVSEVLPEDIRAHGGIPIMYRTGHSLIEAEMHRQDISLTGEMSGHIFFGKDFNYYGFDDACFAALKLLEYLSSQEKTLTELVAELPKYISTPIINIDAPDELKHKIINKIVEEFKKDNYKVVDVDGARVYLPDGSWGLVRASNTTPLLVLRFESKTEEGLKKIKEIFKEKLDKYKELGKEWKPTA